MKPAAQYTVKEDIHVLISITGLKQFVQHIIPLRLQAYAWWDIRIPSFYIQKTAAVGLPFSVSVAIDYRI
jgi:hypothetical protein